MAELLDIEKCCVCGESAKGVHHSEPLPMPPPPERMCTRCFWRGIKWAARAAKSEVDEGIGFVTSKRKSGKLGGEDG